MLIYICLSWYDLYKLLLYKCEILTYVVWVAMDFLLEREREIFLDIWMMIFCEDRVDQIDIWSTGLKEHIWTSML